jgi:Domain of unknown function (DUF4129)
VRLRPDLLRAVLLALLMSPVPALPAASVVPPPTKVEIERAIATVKADPNLATEKKVTRLVWNSQLKPRERRTSRNWSWLSDLFQWIADGSAIVVWVLLAGLASLLVVFIVRLVRQNGLPERNRRFVAPTHVHDLDIRPESLPPDIGAAARALWDGGEQRAALALLYRGMLSRLAHVYEVPIRESSTEGDCLTLAARTLDAPRVEYATQLVRTWQRAIYGGLTIDTAQVWDLCARFAANLDAAAPATTTGRAVFAAEASA